MSVFRRKRTDGTWQWHYRKQITLPSGKQERIHGTPSRNTKLAAERAERDHIERETNPPPAPPAERAKVDTLAVFSEEFLDGYCKANKPSERAAKRIAFRKHLIPELGHLRLDEIRVRDVEALKSKLLGKKVGKSEKPLSRKTINNVLAVLSKTLRHAKKIQLIDSAPEIELLKLDKQDFEFLDFADYAALVKAARAEPEWLVAVLLGGDAGLRLGEIRALKLDHWERNSNQITVSEALWYQIEGSTKGRNTRSIPLTSRLEAALKAIRHLKGPGPGRAGQQPYLLCDDDGKHLTNEQMRWNLPRLCRRAGIRPIGWHALRHTFCSHLAMRGAPARTIQELAGHADLTTTMRYMHLVPGAKAEAIGLLEQSDATRRSAV